MYFTTITRIIFVLRNFYRFKLFRIVVFFLFGIYSLETRAQKRSENNATVYENEKMRIDE